ncbi:MAG: hypothetical protein AAGC82_05865 [Pseudomonadota bacterium]
MQLTVSGRPVLTTALAPLGAEAWARRIIPDANLFWAAFVQADRLVLSPQGGETTELALRDQSVLAAFMGNCLYPKGQNGA